MNQKITKNKLLHKKGKEKITAITAYDALMANIFDGEVDLILVGDSLKMSFGGDDETIGASLHEMIYHAKAVSRGVSKSFLLADLPFGTYTTKDVALKNCIRFYKECRIDALKLEVNIDKADIIKSLCSEGMSIMAHIGLKPQFMRFDGGFKIKGKDNADRNELLECALAMQEAGAFGILIEGVKGDVAKDITDSLSIPTIGIGAGVHCDGQILVWSDAFGFFDKFKPKFVRQYCNGKEILQNAIRQYVDDVRNARFPDISESY